MYSLNNDTALRLYYEEQQEDEQQEQEDYLLSQHESDYKDE